jgi:redox-sensitive bicupin YhaK (pirin superfamily)
MLPGQVAYGVRVPEAHSVFAYVFEGDAFVGGKSIARGELAILEQEGDVVDLRAGDEGARLILVAGKPLREPIAKYGPFVMNTKQQIHEAIADYQAGRF